MARDLSADMQAGAVAQVVEPVLLYEGEFPSGTTRMWTGIGPLEWNGHTWLGAGNFLGISPVEETTEFKATGVEVQLSGVPQSLLSLALQEMRLGNKGKVYLGLIGDAVAHSGTAQAGGSDELTLAADASSVDGFYNGKRLRLGDGRERRIISYNGTTKVAKVEKRWITNEYQYSRPSNAYFTKGDMSVTAAAALDRDGNMLADKLHAGTGSGVKDLYKTMAGVRQDAPVRFKADLRAGELQRVRFIVFDSATTTWFYSDINLATGQASAITTGSSVGGVSVGGTVSVTPLGGGLHECIITGIPNVAGGTGNCSGRIRLLNNSGQQSFTGDGVSGIYASGLQFEKTDALPWDNLETNGTAVPMPDDSTTYEVLEYGVINDPLLLFEGQTDVPTIQEGGEDATLAVAYESRLIAMMQPHEVRYTDEEQQRRYPGDTGFAWVASLQDKEIVW